MTAIDKPLDIHAYLAGPDVFYADAVVRGERKKAFLKTLGITGHFPFDNEIPPSHITNPADIAAHIARANELQLLGCCENGRTGIVLADISPYHGVSLDTGTAHEIGFASALHMLGYKMHIFAYTSDSRTYEKRLEDDYFLGNLSKGTDGRTYGKHAQHDTATALETFGLADNLMIMGAIQHSGGKVFESFELAARAARTHLQHIDKAR